jgi:hypothetical protein
LICHAALNAGAFQARCSKKVTPFTNELASTFFVIDAAVDSDAPADHLRRLSTGLWRQ